MFYDKYAELCFVKGVSPSKAATDAGLSKSTVTKWKSNPDSMPTGAALEKLSSYFHVSFSYLLEEKENPLSEDRGMPARYDELSPSQKRLIDEMIRQFLKEDGKK